MFGYQDDNDYFYGIVELDSGGALFGGYTWFNGVEDWRLAHVDIDGVLQGFWIWDLSKAIMLNIKEESDGDYVLMGYATYIFFLLLLILAHFFSFSHKCKT